MLELKQRKGRPYWYLRGTVRSISVYESTGIVIENKKAAEELRTRREAELLEESIHGKSAVVTFSQAALSWLEAGGDPRYIGKFIRHFGPTRKLSTIHQDDIDIAVRTVLPYHAVGTKIRQGYAPISAVLHHAAQRKWCDDPTIKKPKLDNAVVRWITYEEANRLIKGCAPNLRPLVVLLLYTGARIGEALWLDWRHVSLERKHVDFVDTKNGTSRGVPLHPRVIAELERIQHRMGCVFLNRWGKVYRRLDPNDPNDVSAGTRIRKGFQNAVSRAGLTNFRVHDCRHTWATWHYQANRDLGALQKLGGWSEIKMVMRYAHTNVEEHEQTILRLR